LRRSTVTWGRRIPGDYGIPLFLWRPMHVSGDDSTELQTVTSHFARCKLRVSGRIEATY
jgi:hypothetical protein